MANLSETVLTPKKRRGPKPSGKGLIVGVRLQPAALRRLDEFRKQFPDNPNRPEAIRRLLETLEGLT